MSFNDFPQALLGLGIKASQAIDIVDASFMQGSETVMEFADYANGDDLLLSLCPCVY